MKIDAENPRYEAMLMASENNPETIVEGTFCVVRQTKLIELWSFSEAGNIYYVVTTSALSKGFDGVCNPSFTAGKSPLYEIYADNQETTYFDNQLEAHQFFCDFIMQNQLEGM